MPKAERKPYTHEATMLFEKVGGSVGSRKVNLYETSKMWCISPYDRFRKDTGYEYGTRGFRFHRRKWLDLESVSPLT
jgi:hypothetical protein